MRHEHAPCVKIAGYGSIGRTPKDYTMNDDTNESTMRARFFLFSGTALYAGPMEDAAEHRHHALQVCIGLDRPFELWDGPVRHVGRFAVIKPDHGHRFCGKGGRHALILMDRELSLSKNIDAVTGNERGVLVLDQSPAERETRALRSLLDMPADCHTAKELCHSVVDRFCGTDATENTEEDPRIRSAKRLMGHAPDSKMPISAIAREVGLSESRLIHVFKEHTGIPIRRYLLWLRLVEAVEQMSAHVSITVSAHGAGFADSAHLSRTFRRMFGISPSFLFKNSRFIQVISCVD